MADERITVRATATGQELEVVVFSKRLDSITVVLGEGVHSVRVDLTPTRNGLAYAGKALGRDIVYERSREDVKTDLARASVPRLSAMKRTASLRLAVLTLAACVMPSAASSEPKILPDLTLMYRFANGQYLVNMVYNPSDDIDNTKQLVLDIVLLGSGVEDGAQSPSPKRAPQDGTPVRVAISSFGGCPGARASVFAPRQNFLYVANGNICAYALDVANGTATPVAGMPFRAGAFARSLARDRAGNFLYAVNQDSNNVSGFFMNPSTGVLTEVVGSPVAAGTEPFAGAVDGAGRYLYVANNGSSNVSAYAIDAATGALAPVSGSPFAAPGRPWSIAADPYGKYIYAGAIGIQAYRIEAGGVLTPIGAPVSTNSYIAKGIAVDPTGRFVYASWGFGEESGVQAYAIGASGALTAVGPRAATGDNPLGVAVDTTGQFVYVANLLGQNVSGFQIDATTGALSPIAGSPFEAGENPTGVTTSGVMNAATTWKAGEYFAAPLGVAGGRPPYAFSIADGGLPPGLALDSLTGMITGTPLTAGTYAFTSRAADSNGTVASQAYTLSIRSASTPSVVTVVEYYNAALDHYFITWLPDEIAKLDAGMVIKGWARTSKSFKALAGSASGASPICRYYIPPALGDSHFFGRGAAECAATGQKNPTFVLEDPAFMQMYLPNQGACPPNTTAVYRVFDNRPDANHRYTVDRAIRAQMVAQGWIAEGDGPDLVVMCAPQ